MEGYVYCKFLADFYYISCIFVRCVQTVKFSRTYVQSAIQCYCWNLNTVFIIPEHGCIVKKLFAKLICCFDSSVCRIMELRSLS